MLNWIICTYNIKPNKIEAVNIPLQDILHTIKKNHRIMIQIHSITTNSVFKPLLRVKRIPCESRKYSFFGLSTPSKFSRTESFKMAVRVCVFNVLEVFSK